MFLSISELPLEAAGNPDDPPVLEDGEGPVEEAEAVPVPGPNDAGAVPAGPAAAIPVLAGSNEAVPVPVGPAEAAFRQDVWNGKIPIIQSNIPLTRYELHTNKCK